MLVFGFIFGAILGSFSKALADRTINQISFWGRSYCESCKHKLSWYDLFPILSYLILRGRCRYCGRRIPLDDFLAEILVGLIITAAFYLFLLPHLDLLLTPSWQSFLLLLDFFFKSFIVVVLVIVFWVDLKVGLIPDRITIPSIIITVIYLLVSSAVKVWVFYQNILQVPFGKYLLPPYSDYFLAIVQKMVMGIIYNILTAVISSLAFVLMIVITKGKGMGWGDVKLVLLIGLVLGFPYTLVALFLAFLFGAVVALLLLVLGKKHFGQTIPFGPFLAFATLVTLFWGQQIFNWYLTSFKLGY